MGRTPPPREELIDPRHERRQILNELRTLAGRLLAIVEVLEHDLGDNDG